MVSLKDVDTFYINHSNKKINVVSADIDEVEIYLLLNDSGPGILMDKEKRKIMIRVKNDITRLVKINQMFQLKIRIPSKFKGEIIIDGISGSVVGKARKRTTCELLEVKFTLLPQVGICTFP